MVFQDHFSGHAEAYAAHRPTYPPELFAFLAEVSPGHRTAWDCGTGSGQAALVLAQHFDSVVATDGAHAQLAQLPPHPRVARSVALAERSALAAGSVDLVTVAQALHWFDPDAFHAEVKRVLRPGGVVAAWCYTLVRIDPEVDRIVDAFYSGEVGAYWPPERAWVMEAYRSIAFPHAEIEAPAFEIRAQWSLEALLGYLGTWSATRRFMDVRGLDPRERVADALRHAWPAARGAPVVARWPIGIRVGRVGAAGRPA